MDHSDHGYMSLTLVPMKVMWHHLDIIISHNTLKFLFIYKTKKKCHFSVYHPNRRGLEICKESYIEQPVQGIWANHIDTVWVR